MDWGGHKGKMRSGPIYILEVNRLSLRLELEVEGKRRIDVDSFQSWFLMVTLTEAKKIGNEKL